MSIEEKQGLVGRLFEALKTPWVDKTIAIVAVLPFAYEIVKVFLRGDLNIPRAGLALQFIVVIVTMISRTAPINITRNPIYWALAFFASYWGLFVAALADRGTPVFAVQITNALTVLAVIIAFYARFSLGRSIGLVPAKRAIVTGGAYRIVRHPIYTGLFISYLAFALRAYSPGNLALALMGIGMFVVKSFIEESFLREDREYAAYLDRVRWRWFPGLA